MLIRLLFISARIVNAACILHNIAVHWRLPEPELYYDAIDQEFPIRNVKRPAVS